MAENVVTCYNPHFHLGMRVMTLIWCFRGWQVCKRKGKQLDRKFPVRSNSGSH